MADAPATTQNDADAHERSATAPARPYLFVVLHRDRPLAGGSRHDLAELDGVVIGRGAERSARRARDGDRRLELRLPGGTVSSTHARLERGGAGWALVDEGSKNGTFDNGERVPKAPRSATAISSRSARCCSSTAPRRRRPQATRAQRRCARRAALAALDLDRRRARHRAGLLATLLPRTSPTQLAALAAHRAACAHPRAAPR